MTEATMTKEQLEEKIAKAVGGKPVEMIELAMALAFIGMQKLSREQQRDIILAAFTAHRVVVTEHVAGIITGDFKDLEASSCMSRLAAVMLQTEEKKKAVLERFFNLTHMLRD